ncbi:MAG: NAD-binding protein [Chloroflexota bacterium]
MAIFLQLLRDRPTRLDILALFRFLAVVAIVIAIYSIIFHYIMEYEGRTYSWITGIYWTLTVMSTLGFGDITFESDLGRAFSGIVLLSGMIFLLILLPFTFIEFFYAPWMKAQEAARAPRKLPEKTTGHAVLTHFDAVTDTLITKLMQYKHEYVLLIDDLTEALRLHELGYRVMLGDLDDPETYRQARVEQAMFVAATGNDQTNTNVTFTVREISESVPIIAVANRHASIDILQLAGSSHVLELGKTMGQALSRQVTNNTSRAQVIGAFGALHIAEASARGTSLVGKTVQASEIHEQAGAHVVGIWERGAFQQAQPETRITADTILILAGTETQLNAYNEHFCHNTLEDAPIVVIGGGRVGRAVGQTLAKKGLDYRIIEKNRERIPLTNANHYIAGDAAELEKLEAAGIRQAPAVIITTHDDDMNVYLTIYCRRLRPDAQIISRAVQDRNVSTLHRAGADFVLSYASTGANAILNLMRDDEIVMVDEALDIFEVPIPESLAGRPLDECNIRDKTGCIVVAMHDDHTPEIIRDQQQALLSSGRLILVGTPDAEERFLKLYK